MNKIHGIYYASPEELKQLDLTLPKYKNRIIRNIDEYFHEKTMIFIQQPSGKKIERKVPMMIPAGHKNRDDRRASEKRIRNPLYGFPKNNIQDRTKHKNW
jgi:hypothetical protein